MVIEDLSGKVALITGVSRQAGIGAAIARALAGVGAAVFTTYYRPYDNTMEWGSEPSEAEQIVADLQAMGVRAAGIEADLSDIAMPARLFDQVEQTVGPVDILVNNATHSVNVNWEALTAVTLDQHYAINLRGMALLCVEMGQRFRGENGRIINITSGQSTGPMPGELPYAATKGAVDAFTVTLAAELAPRGITVNAIDPGITDTGWIPAALKAEWEAHAPLGRVGRPEDAAQLVRFLASAEAGWITGQIMHSRGGL
jgi:3-oxoacyl-[acyl-carrier protein] reductase